MELWLKVDFALGWQRHRRRQHHYRRRGSFSYRQLVSNHPQVRRHQSWVDELITTARRSQNAPQQSFTFILTQRRL